MKKILLKKIAFYLCVIMIAMPISNAYATTKVNNTIKEYESILENEEIILKHLNAKPGMLFSMEDSFLGKDQDDSINQGNLGITPFVVGSTSTEYAPLGGRWEYSYGGPTSTAINYQIKYDKVVYMTRDEIISILGNGVTAQKWSNLKSALVSLGIQGGTKYVNATFTGLMKSFLLRLFLTYASIEIIVGILEDIEKAQNEDILIAARDNGNGLIYEYYKYTYNGYWYNASVKTEWTNEPYAPIPGSQYGVGNFYKNVITGWYQFNGNWYWYENGQPVASVWREIDGYWYYFKSDTVMATGWLQIG